MDVSVGWRWRKATICIIQRAGRQKRRRGRISAGCRDVLVFDDVALRGAQQSLCETGARTRRDRQRNVRAQDQVGCIRRVGGAAVAGAAVAGTRRGYVDRAGGVRSAVFQNADIGIFC